VTSYIRHVVGKFKHLHHLKYKLADVSAGKFSTPETWARDTGRQLKAGPLSFWPHNIQQLFVNCETVQTLECGPIPDVMAALPDRGGALYSTPQSLADAHYCRSAVQ